MADERRLYRLDVELISRRQDAAKKELELVLARTALARAELERRLAELGAVNQSFAVAEPPHLAFDFVAIDATSALPEDGLKGKGPGEPFVQALSQIGEGFTKLDGHIGQPFYNGGKTIEKAFCHVTDLLDSFFPGNTPKRQHTEEGYLSDSDDEMSIEEMQMRFQAFQLWAHGAAWQRRTRKRDAKLAVRVQAWRQRHDSSVGFAALRRACAAGQRTRLLQNRADAHSARVGERRLLSRGIRTWKSSLHTRATSMKGESNATAEPLSLTPMSTPPRRTPNEIRKSAQERAIAGAVARLEGIGARVSPRGERRVTFPQVMTGSLASEQERERVAALWRLRGMGGVPTAEETPSTTDAMREGMSSSVEMKWVLAKEKEANDEEEMHQLREELPELRDLLPDTGTTDGNETTVRSTSPTSKGTSPEGSSRRVSRKDAFPRLRKKGSFTRAKDSLRSFSFPTLARSSSVPALARANMLRV